MAKEVRYLLLSTEEIHEALSGYHASTSSGPKYETGMKLCLFETPKGAGARMTLCSFHNNSTEPREFATSEVLGALLMFCRNHRIPMAMRSHKTIEIFGNQLALMTTINLATTEPAVTDNKLVYKDDEMEVTGSPEQPSTLHLRIGSSDS